MEAIYGFMKEWAMVLLMLCIIALVLLAPGNLKNIIEEKDASGDGEAENDVDGNVEEDNDEEPETEDDVEVLGEAVKDDVVVSLGRVDEVRNIPPRRFGKYTATSQTDAVLAAYPELLPDGYEELEKLRKEFKTLGGKPAAEMTKPERTRYAVLAHILTVFR